MAGSSCCVTGYCHGVHLQGHTAAAKEYQPLTEPTIKCHDLYADFLATSKMTSEFSAADLAIIGKLHPEVWVEPMPSLDEIVVEFLRLHEVNIRPASSDVAPSRMTNAAMGAMGPGYLAVNTHLTQQAKAAALQEWISWKQWALSHEDFPLFKDKVRQRYHKCKSESDAFITQNREELKAEIKKFRESQTKEQRKVLLLVASLVALLFLISEIPRYIDSLGAPPPRERRD